MMNKNDPRIASVMDKHKGYLNQAKQSVKASERLLKNLDDIFAASVNLQCYITNKKPVYDYFGNRITDCIFEPDYSTVFMVLILDGREKAGSWLPVCLVKELEKAVLDPAHAAKMIVMSKDKFDKRYPETYGVEGKDRYTLAQSILKSILQ
jgi:hypothetical protein